MYTDFEFANQRLSDFGCIMCHINTESGSREIDIGCDITFTTIKNNHSSVHSATSSSYENVYTTTFDIIKYSCNNSGDDIYMTSLEVRNLMKWLNRRSYHKFKLLNDITLESDVHYYGSFNAKQVMHGNNILGLSLTFTSNAPYGFGEMIGLSFMVTNPGDKFNIYGDSDEYGVIYPTIKIRSFYKQSISITNETTSHTLELDNCLANETIVIDGEHKIIVSDNEEHNETIANDFNYEYFDILVDESGCEYDSVNTYEVSAPCEISVYYSPIRKVGVY